MGEGVDELQMQGRLQPCPHAHPRVSQAAAWSPRADMVSPRGRAAPQGGL